MAIRVGRSQAARLFVLVTGVLVWTAPPSFRSEVADSIHPVFRATKSPDRGDRSAETQIGDHASAVKGVETQPVTSLSDRNGDAVLGEEGPPRPDCGFPREGEVPGEDAVKWRVRVLGGVSVCNNNNVRVIVNRGSSGNKSRVEQRNVDNKVVICVSDDNTRGGEAEGTCRH